MMPNPFDTILMWTVVFLPWAAAVYVIYLMTQG